MEDSVQQVTVTPEVVRSRLQQLEQLVSDLEKVTTTLKDVKGRQGPGMWSRAQACTSFTTRTSGALNKLSGWLAHDLGKIAHLRDSLEASWRALGAVDQNVEDRLLALANRLETAAPRTTPTPAPTPTPTSTPTPTPTPTPSPSPGPTPTPSPTGGGGSW